LSIPANWYKDPSNPLMLRWWDGVQWGPQTQPLFAPPTVQTNPSVPAPTANTRKVASSAQLLRHNGLGFAGAAVSLGSLLINPVCTLSILGIVFCSIGLANDAKLHAAGNRVTGRGWVIAGLVIGIASTLFYSSAAIAVLARVFSLL
jgi:Protein of unknown function (DUF2510)